MTDEVWVLTTGGTIAQASRPGGPAAPGFDPTTLVADLDLAGVTISVRPVMSKGSKDLIPSDWVTIAAAVAECVQAGARGVIVLHGTDTMHYTAAALSYMLRGLSVPVVLTGSMIPGGDRGSDAFSNLRDAVAVAATADLAEVCVVFSADAERTCANVIRGTRARKAHSQAIAAFESVDAPVLGVVRDGRVIHDQSVPSVARASRDLMLHPELDDAVTIVKLTPTTTPGMLDRMLSGTSGVVLEGTGVGHLKFDLHPVVNAYAKPAVMSTQAAHGGEHLGAYSGDVATLKLPNIIPAGDLTSEAAMVKLMWLLPRGGDVSAAMRDMTIERGLPVGSGIGS